MLRAEVLLKFPFKTTRGSPGRGRTNVMKVRAALRDIGTHLNDLEICREEPSIR